MVKNKRRMEESPDEYVNDLNETLANVRKRSTH